MTGKKKNMNGGIYGLVPYQPKYNPDTVKNNTFNEYRFLFSKKTQIVFEEYFLP